MCGIVAYVGKREVLPVLLDGLKRVEYRGYDSAGLALQIGDNILNKRVHGPVSNLIEKIRQTQSEVSLVSHCGIAHTRWATHGEPSEQNAHPHSDASGSIHIAHNGIIENHQELREQLVDDGYIFSSETDSEVIAHLIAKYRKEYSFEEAVQHALSRLVGSYAIVALDSTTPGKIIGARLTGPLRIGATDSGMILASDPAAIIEHTTQVIDLSDHEMVIIDQSGYNIVSLESKTESPTEMSHSHYAIKEIFEEPEAVENTWRGRLLPEDGLSNIGGFIDVESRLKYIKRVHFIGCGTASYAGLYAKCLMEEIGQLPADASPSSEFRYGNTRLDPEKDAVIAISQSGETADTLAAVKEAKRRGVLTLGMVNVVGSSIAAETDGGMHTHAGREVSVLSTKAFMSQMAAAVLIALYFGRQRTLSPGRATAFARACTHIPDKMRDVLSQSSNILRIAEKYIQHKNFFVIGRKANLPVALEGALKLKEGAYRNAQGMSAGELKHGPLALIDQDFPTIAICPKDGVYEKNMSSIEEIKSRGGPVIAIATEGDSDIKRIADDVIYVPETHAFLYPLLTTIPLHLFAYYTGVTAGINPDRPRNLAKSVTVE